MTEPDRCAACGRFVSVWEGYTDVEPGGCRGHDHCATYCGEACADRTYEFAHADLGRECTCEA